MNVSNKNNCFIVFSRFCDTFVTIETLFTAFIDFMVRKAGKYLALLSLWMPKGGCNMTFRNRFFGYIFFACTLLYLFNACSNDDSSTNTSGTQTITVTITEPADGFATSQSDLVSFSGTALYDNSNTQLPADSLRWRSDVDGEIGIGNQFNRNGLSPGTHQVTLTANGASGESGSASIQFTAQQKTLSLIHI